MSKWQSKSIFMWLGVFLIASCILMCNNAARVHLNLVQASRVCQMLQDGRTQRDAAVVFGVSQTCIRNIWNQFQDTGSFTRRPGSGRPRVTDVRDDRYINLLTRRNAFYSAPRVLWEVRQTRGINVGVQTIRNRLHDTGLRARRPNVVPVLTQNTGKLDCSGLVSIVAGHSTNGPEFSSQTNPDSPWITTMDVLGCGDVVEKGSFLSLR